MIGKRKGPPPSALDFAGPRDFCRGEKSGEKKDGFFFFCEKRKMGFELVLSRGSEVGARRREVRPR